MLKLMERVKDKLFGKATSDVELLRQQALQGERLEGVVISGAFDILVDDIFSPLEQEAFKAFKTVDPSNFYQVCQAQQYGKVVDEVKRRVERKIELGRSARQRLIELASQED